MSSAQDTQGSRGPWCAPSLVPLGGPSGAWNAPTQSYVDVVDGEIGLGPGSG